MLIYHLFQFEGFFLLGGSRTLLGPMIQSFFNSAVVFSTVVLLGPIQCDNIETIYIGTYSPLEASLKIKYINNK